MKTRTALPFILTGLCLVLAAGCSTPNRYKSLEQSPGAPRIDTVFVSTRNDTTACIRIAYTDTNTLAVTFRIERADLGGPDFRPRVYGIPSHLTVYHDDYPDSLPQAYNEFRYRMTAATESDSISPVSNTASIELLDTPPAIDSVVTTAGYPVVHYRIFGGRGNEWIVEIVKNDSVIAHSQTYLSFSDETRTASFDELTLDTLRTRWPAGPSENGTFGARVIVTVLKAQAIAVAGFKVGP
ncbi:MAG: hypothetical protein V1913_17950 [Fibrobacterota bacterium]